MQTVRRILRSNTFPLILLVILNLVVGLMVLPDYGESWDEAGLFGYAERSLRAYPALLDPASMPVSLVRGDPLFGDHGPAYVMAIVLLRRFISAMGISVMQVHVGHFVYFLTFQAGIVALYFLCRRWMSAWAAFGAILLFSTQPLLWGHAFINPKDTPFMAFFTISLALGLWMVDRTKIVLPPERSNAPSLRSEWASAPPTGKKKFAVILLVWLTLALALWILGAAVVQSLVENAYNDGPASFIGRLFRQIAPQAQNIPVGEYVRKALVFLKWAQAGMGLFGLGLLGWAFAVLAPVPFRSVLGWLAKTGKATLVSFASPDVLLAGFVLGFTAAVRIVAPLAGVIVVGIAFLRKKADLPRLLTYTVISILVMIALWPHLWPDLFGRLFYSFSMSSTYPLEMKTLFAGQVYIANQIPRAYLPVLLGLQLTETTLILSIAGLGVAFASLLRKNLSFDYLFLLVFWFFLPFIGFVASGTPLFDNFRHVLFILPPLFLLCGTALDWLFTKVTSPASRSVALALIVFPALLAGVRLHPYEYIYYNQLTGGVQGAFRQYQLDYWDISYREVALYLNQIAPQNARIVPIGPYHTMRFYARPDLKFIDPYTVASWQDYDYIVVGTRDNQDRDFAQFETVYAVERDGVPLAVVKKP
jgi:hypothetical protein